MAILKRRKSTRSLLDKTQSLNGRGVLPEPADFNVS